MGQNKTPCPLSTTHFAVQGLNKYKFSLFTEKTITLEHLQLSKRTINPFNPPFGKCLLYWKQKGEGLKRKVEFVTSNHLTRC